MQHQKCILYISYLFGNVSVQITIARIHGFGRGDKRTFSSSLEEESYYEDLQPGHAHHHDHLDQAEMEDSLLCALDRAEVAVLTCTEIFLHPTDGAQLAAHFKNHVFQHCRLFGR